jgi:hypothetical protein
MGKKKIYAQGPENMRQLLAKKLSAGSSPGWFVSSHAFPLLASPLL